MNSIIQSVLANYDLPQFESIESLGSAGGFSGAQLWRLTSADASKQFCLRRWPKPHPNREILDWIHLVLVHSRVNQLDYVAAPIQTTRGQTVVDENQSFWELSRWMPGVADFSSNPSDERLKNMMESLARFHMSSAQVNLDFRPSQSIRNRLKYLEEVPATLEQIGRVETAASSPSVDPEIRHELGALRQALNSNGRTRANEIAKQLAVFENMTLPLQPVIRDVWHDHVLFTGNRVTGLVDFGAMQMDTVALDVSRLLGSTVGGDQERLNEGIEYYSNTRRLGEPEQRLVSLIDRATTLLGGLNWLKWIVVENRSFENWSLVKNRIEFFRNRLT